MVGNGLAQLTKFGRHLLELFAVICNKKITLNEVLESGVEMEGTYRAIPKELGLDGKPCRACSGVALEDGVGEVVGNCSSNP